MIKNVIVKKFNITVMGNESLIYNSFIFDPFSTPDRTNSVRYGILKEALGVIWVSAVHSGPM